MGRSLHKRGNKKDLLNLVLLLSEKEVTRAEAVKQLNFSHNQWNSALTDASFYFPIYEIEGRTRYETRYGMLPLDFSQNLKKLRSFTEV